MNKIFLPSLLLFLCTVLCVSCNIDEIGGPKVAEGMPARMILDLELPASSDVSVDTRGINDYESEIDELLLVMFEANGRKMTIDLTGKLSATGPADGIGGHRIYQMTSDITESEEGPLLSGNYTVYAIANWTSPFCGLTKQEIMAMDRTQLSKAFSRNDQGVLTVVGHEKMPMTSVTPDVVIAPVEETPQQAGSPVSIKLRRVISHIEFEFVNGTNEQNPRFIPRSYTVFNVPKTAYLFNQGTPTDNSANAIAWQPDPEFLNIPSERQEIGSDNLIQFYMLENVKMSENALTGYGDRDKWNAPGVPGAVLNKDKQFINAPEGSTFLAVDGRYTGKDYTGNVVYTVHLGNFCNSVDGYGQTGSLGNYTVNRNEFHKYKIVINGVNSIVAEAKVEGDQANGGRQPGAEGVITSTVGNQFVLDSHYETVMLKIPNDNKLGSAKVTFFTPYNQLAKQYAPSELTDQMDYKWVKFMKPSSTTQFPKYDPNQVCDVKRLCEEINALGGTGTVNGNLHYMISGNSIYVVAFVDEYFYADKPWTEFVNRENRFMALAPQPYVSADRNSVLYSDYYFQLEQRSIKTVYNVNHPELNAFGIETWDETGMVGNGGGSGNDKSDTHAWQRSRNLMGNTWIQNLSKAGYIDAITDNSKTAHRFNGVSVDANTACLTRNRDENNNGTIDPEEVKWYLPSIEQYYSLWMGLDLLKEDTQLFDPSEMPNINSNEDLGKYNYYTCSPDKGRIYWAVEGASAGGFQSGNNNVRCVRNLVNQTGEAANTYSYDPQTNIITVNNASASAIRTQAMSGEYAAGHNERSADNRLYYAFQVAKENLQTNRDTPAVMDGESGTFSTKGWTVECVRTGGTVNRKFQFTVHLNSLNPKFNYSYSYGQTDVSITSPSFTTPEITNNAIELRVSLKSTTVTKSFDINYNSGNPEITEAGGGSLQPSYTLSTGNAVLSPAIPSGTSSFTIAMIGTCKEGLCATNYSEEPDGSDLGLWRVPNQRELMLMGATDPARFLPGADGGNKSYASRTFFTRTNFKHQPFSFIGNITLDAGDNGGLNKNFIIRCVRDAEVSAPSQPTSDASYKQASVGPIF